MVDLRLTHFSAALLVPPSSYPPLIGGFILLLVCIYTLTYTTPASRTPCTLIRLALSPFAIYLFWDHGYNLAYGAPGAQVAVGMAVVGLYGIMRVVETNVVSLMDGDGDGGPPVWVRREDGKRMALPTGFRERMEYAVDLATSLRGTSWFGDRYWDWAPGPLRMETERETQTRGAFVMRSVGSVVAHYVLLDFVDSLNKSRSWDSAERFPISTLPVPEQLVFSVSVLLGTALSISVTYGLVRCVAVLLGSDPVCWPRMFDNPLRATSLREFWTRRWHAIFRRVFARLSLLALVTVPERYGRRVRAVVRAVCVFAMSAGVHVLLMYRLELERPSHPSLLHTFLDPSILKFFLVQPLGLAVEAFLVQPFARRMSRKEEVRRVVGRVWAWGFMLWVGRFWSDAWVKRGMWGEGEHVVGYSVVRGLVWGKWEA